MLIGPTMDSDQNESTNRVDNHNNEQQQQPSPVGEKQVPKRESLE